MKRLRRALPLVAGALLASAGTAAAAPAAELEIQHQVPTARNTRDASTYTNSTMRLVNKGTVAITGLSMDLQPGATVIPDLVFDPLDATPAGDVVMKSFQVNSAPAGMTATAGYRAPQDDGYRRLDVALSGLAPSATMAFSIDVDPTSIKGAPLTALAGPVSGAEMAGALVTVRFADGSELRSRLSPVPNTGTDIPNGLTNARAVLPAPAARPTLSRPGGSSAPAVVSNLTQRVVVTGPAGATGKVVTAEGHTSLGEVPGGGNKVSPFEPNMLFRGHAPVPFTIGPDGTATVAVTLTREVPDAVTATGMNVVTAYLESGGKPGPASQPLILQAAPAAAGAISLHDPAGDAPGTYARRIGGTSHLSEALPLTVSAWFKAPADGVTRPIAQHGPNTDNIDGVAVTKAGWTLERRGDMQIGWTLNSSDPGFYTKFDPVVPADTWVFVAVVATPTSSVLHTWDAGNGWRIHAKGPISPYVPPAPGDYLSIGASKGAPRAEFTGLIDDVRVWSVARGQDAIRGDAATRLTGSEPGLAGYWPFDDGAGHVVADLAPVPEGQGPNTLFLTGDAGTFPFDWTGDWATDTPIADPARDGAPTILGRLPVPGAADVSSRGPIAVRFSEPMDADATRAAIGLRLPDGAAVPAVVTAGAGGTHFSVAPAAPLPAGTEVEVTVDAAARDLAGTASGAPGSWRFTVVPDAPSSVGAPAVVGTPRVGTTVACIPGEWSGAPEFSYRWFADGAQIAGATGATLTLAAAHAGKLVSCGVIADGAGGQAWAMSPAVGPVAADPPDPEDPGDPGTTPTTTTPTTTTPTTTTPTTTTPTTTTPTTTTPTTTTPTTTTPTTTTPTTTMPTTTATIVIPPPGPDLPGEPAPPGPGVKERPAFCAKYPKLRTSLARQLVAAKRARQKAVRPKARRAAAKRIVTVKASQKRAGIRFRAVCRTAR